MRVGETIGCSTFPCLDVEHGAYSVPDVDVDPDAIRVLMVSEVAPPDAVDGYYAAGDPLFARTTVQAFRDAGADVSSMADVLALGVYVTTAVKCAKTSYAVATGTITTCSQILEAELALFPRARSLLLMGDVAIKAVNAIARRNGAKRVIPAGSTYKLRGGVYTFATMRAFPSYLQAGPSFFIEKSKRTMIAEDIASALRHAAA